MSSTVAGVSAIQPGSKPAKAATDAAPEHKKAPDAGIALGALASHPPASGEPAEGEVIAVDLDDVLGATNKHIADWHNKMYGTKMTLDDFHYYHYWKNPYWGNPIETFKKVKKYYDCGAIYEGQVIDGALQGLKQLKAKGYRLIVVTARQKSQLDRSWQWLEEHFPGVFESVICIGQFEEAIGGKGHEIITKLTKFQVCKRLSAVLLIDDSLDNALACSSQNKHEHEIRHPSDIEYTLPVLLFGEYEWNKRPSVVKEEKDKLSFEERLALEGREWWKEENVRVPYAFGEGKGEGEKKVDAEGLWRVRDWSEVVRWVEVNM